MVLQLTRNQASREWIIRAEWPPVRGLTLVPFRASDLQGLGRLSVREDEFAVIAFVGERGPHVQLLPPPGGGSVPLRVDRVGRNWGSGTFPNGVRVKKKLFGDNICYVSCSS